MRYRPDRSSSTFHGRDILAPAAAMLAKGERQTVRGDVVDPILLDVDVARERTGIVIHIDTYGNATTNIPAAVVGRATVAQIGRRKIPIRRTYADMSVGKPLALIGSSDLLEIAVRDGSAAFDLKIDVGDEVVLK
jgi:S-adenosylmethionine hydrolase